jgi:circadian clock protein KaiB
MSKKKLAKKKAVKKEVGGEDEEKYILQLFVAGILPHSTRAIINIKTICEKHLKGRYELEVIDIYQQPSLALTEDVLAIPLLIRKFPRPEVRFIGDLSNTEKVLEGLNLI